MNLLNKFTDNLEFDNYKDFVTNFQITTPDNFNFGYDVVDEYARLCPDKVALVWCNDKEEEKILTFGELKILSDKIANALVSQGIKKGDRVMTMLNRRWEYWAITVACSKVGCVIIPATILLTAKDICYRVNSAEVKLVIATLEDEVLRHINDAVPMFDHETKVFTVADGKVFPNFHDLVGKQPENFMPAEKNHQRRPDADLFYIGNNRQPQNGCS